MVQGNRRQIEVEVFPANVSVRVERPRVGVSAGLTVGDFKAALSRLAGDHELLASVEYGTGDMWTGQIEAERGEDGIEIREVR